MAPVTFGFSRQEGTLLSGNRGFAIAKKRLSMAIYNQDNFRPSQQVYMKLKVPFTYVFNHPQKQSRLYQ